jgi:hypothetical protein
MKEKTKIPEPHNSESGNNTDDNSSTRSITLEYCKDLYLRISRIMVQRDHLLDLGCIYSTLGVSERELYILAVTEFNRQAHQLRQEGWSISNLEFPEGIGTDQPQPGGVLYEPQSGSLW